MMYLHPDLRWIYLKATNKHGRRLNKRNWAPMHVMAAFALKHLPLKASNLTQVSSLLCSLLWPAAVTNVVGR